MPPRAFAHFPLLFLVPSPSLPPLQVDYSGAYPATPLQAKTWGAACLQVLGPTTSYGSEDCLFANVWTPTPPTVVTAAAAAPAAPAATAPARVAAAAVPGANAPPLLKPVMVFIYGGSNQVRGCEGRCAFSLYSYGLPSSSHPPPVLTSTSDLSTAHSTVTQSHTTHHSSLILQPYHCLPSPPPSLPSPLRPPVPRTVQFGEAEPYNMSAIAAFHGAVCVTFNYRTGREGRRDMRDGVVYSASYCVVVLFGCTVCVCSMSL